MGGMGGGGGGGGWGMEGIWFTERDMNSLIFPLIIIYNITIKSTNINIGLKCHHLSISLHVKVII
jgi:hypothetical protein